MILANKDIPDATVLKLTAKILKKNQLAKGFKIKTRRGDRTLSYSEIIQFIEELATQLEEGKYGVIRRCDTCGNFSRSGNPKIRGCCFPKNYTSFRNRTDFCSGWIPMSEDQKYVKEKIDGFKSLQTK